mgnify:CR=1 FL=1
MQWTERQPFVVYCQSLEMIFDIETWPVVHHRLGQKRLKLTVQCFFFLDFSQILPHLLYISHV